MGWPAILITPLLALADQALALALTGRACETQNGQWLHAVPLVFLLASVALTVWALASARRHSAASRSANADPPSANAHFIAWVGVGVGALSSLSILAMWVPMWMLSPCAG